MSKLDGLQVALRMANNAVAAEEKDVRTALREIAREAQYALQKLAEGREVHASELWSLARVATTGAVAVERARAARETRALFADAMTTLASEESTHE